MDLSRIGTPYTPINTITTSFVPYTLDDLVDDVYIFFLSLSL